MNSPATPIDDGGPAFPEPYNPGRDERNPTGLSMRDYFAAATLQALLSLRGTHSAITEGRIHQRDVAEGCFEWADLMIAAWKGGEA